ncbi:MAG: hypothetical protein IK070_03395 [Clostridia bacterium]|nr:hypothetical protein [Clostridia bacterium]
MNSMLLGVFDEFVEWISWTPVIIALSLAVVGLALGVLARRIARVIRKTNEIDDKDRALITIKVFAIILLFVAALIMILM